MVNRQEKCVANKADLSLLEQTEAEQKQELKEALANLFSNNPVGEKPLSASSVERAIANCETNTVRQASGFRTEAQKKESNNLISAVASLLSDTPTELIDVESQDACYIDKEKVNLQRLRSHYALLNTIEKVLATGNETIIDVDEGGIIFGVGNHGKTYGSKYPANVVRLANDILVLASLAEKEHKSATITISSSGLKAVVNVD